MKLLGFLPWLFLAVGLGFGVVGLVLFGSGFAVSVMLLQVRFVAVGSVLVAAVVILTVAVYAVFLVVLSGSG